MAPSRAAEREFAPERRRIWPRLVLGILIRIAIPVVFFCSLEGGLRLARYGRPTEFFIPDGSPGSYRTNPDFTATFIPASFGIAPLSFRIGKQKGPNTVRVFVLGESAAQGVPEPEFGLAAQLRVQLKARFPEKTLEVCNLAVASIDSHVVYQIARQVAEFGPDLFVVYMGDDEVIGPYGPGCAYLSSNPPLWFIRASVWFRGTRTGQLLRQMLAKAALPRLRPRDWSGMETFSGNPVRGDDPRLEAVYRNFAANLRDIADRAGKAGIRTVVATVVANVKDNPPFISRHHAGLSDADTKAWIDASEAGAIAWDLGDARSAVVGFGEALRIDPEFAETHFQLARLAETLGAPGIARRRYFDALHWDALHFRPDNRINAIIRQVAGRAGGSVLLVDAAKAMGADPDSVTALAGRELLLDHVHLSWEGNSQMARLVAGGCVLALAGRDPGPGAELDAAGCAAALGYTAHARLAILREVVRETQRAPFTGLSTFSVDQARLRIEVAAAEAAQASPGAKAAAVDAVRLAHRLEPDDAPLAMLLEGMEYEAGNLNGALSLLETAGAFLPPSAELDRRKARVLAGMGRFDEAEKLLLGSIGTYGDPAGAAGPLVDIWAASGRIDSGKRFFARELEGAPSNRQLRLAYAELLLRGGDLAGAEREARRVWDEDPGGRPAAAALGFLVSLYGRQQRADAADALTLEARGRQPFDFANSRRLVRIYTARDDPAKAIESLQAQAACGPFSAAEHLDLAHRLADMNRGLEMLSELAQAREVARAEGSAPLESKIDQLISVYRRRFSHAPAP
ncbi:MAG TPA: hypothetical protein VKG78_07900 [Opitutaceae bacterium]|nr:hypothetical protein [Opitutaceae bacterium]